MLFLEPEAGMKRTPPIRGAMVTRCDRRTAMRLLLQTLEDDRAPRNGLADCLRSKRHCVNSARRLLEISYSVRLDLAKTMPIR